MIAAQRFCWLTREGGIGKRGTGVEPGGKHKKLGSDGDNRRNVAGFNIIFIYIIYLNIYFVVLLIC
jgi:hypothetical protein